MRTSQNSITISASIERIWLLLTDTRGYMRWNSTIEKISGRIASDERINLYMKAVPGHAFRLSVEEFEPVQRMVWVGRVPMGFIWGRLTFKLTPAADGNVVVEMIQEIRKWISPLVTRALPDLPADFNKFASDLKQEAESGVTADRTPSRPLP
jgi:hypothetical protein